MVKISIKIQKLVRAYFAISLSVIMALVFCTNIFATTHDQVQRHAVRDGAKVNHVLVISSYNLYQSTVADQIQGLESALSKFTTDLDYEFMDARNLYKPGDVREFYEYIDYKLKSNKTRRPDLVMLIDDNALRFYNNYGKRLFNDTPVVFMGVNNVDDAMRAAEADNVTGIVEIPEYLGNLKLMKELFPDRTKVVCIVDGSYTGRGEYTLFSDTSSEFDGFTYEILNTMDYSKEGLASAISSIDEDSLILYLDFMEDGDGNIYTDKSASIMISKNAPHIPVFRASSANLGGGVLGGIVYSYKDAGKIAGKMAHSILTGQKSPSDIDVVTDVVKDVIFDQNIMDKFNLTEGDLPDDALIINPHRNIINFYRENMLPANLILASILMMIIIIILLAIENRRREKLINQDFLTKMPNRLCINAKVQQVIDSRKPFGLLMMDVDHFKSINDTMGHPIGDELLISVAERLQAVSSKNVLIARIGGDEFMALITGKSINEGEHIMQEILNSVKKDHNLSCGPVSVTASLGMAFFPKNTSDPTMVQKYADAALYEVKEKGRNGYQLFHPALVHHLENL